MNTVSKQPSSVLDSLPSSHNTWVMWVITLLCKHLPWICFSCLNVWTVTGCACALVFCIWMTETCHSVSGRANFPSNPLSFVKVCCTARVPHFSNFVTEYSPEISISYWPKIASAASFHLLYGQYSASDLSYCCSQ